jgi:hypothetical protein
MDSRLPPEDSSIEMPITPNNPEAWKPVDEWEPLPLLRVSPEPSIYDCMVDSNLLDHNQGIHKNFGLLHAAVVRMANKSAPDILSRLETLWQDVAKNDVIYLLGDSPRVEDLRRWMLSTMIRMDQVPTIENQVAPRRQCFMTARMVVCLYDSAGKCRCCSMLSSTMLMVFRF